MPRLNTSLGIFNSRVISLHLVMSMSDACFTTIPQHLV